MKSITAIVLTLFITTSVLGQDKMKHFGKKIYVDKVPVSLNTAAFMAFEVSTSSYNHIKTAQRIRNWNYFWGVVGGYEVAAGLINATSGNYNSEIGWIDVAIGGVCLGIIPKREERYKMHLRRAVELYNDALEIPEN
jgi:hypothetical protein